ncbi:MAG TPA: hypothetical protein VFR59_01585 [Steroidobacteraceae bacterium]|nr:hypothetical protein [Steroidobacteraceae bacterium]
MLIACFVFDVQSADGTRISAARLILVNAGRGRSPSITVHEGVRKCAQASLCLTLLGCAGGSIAPKCDTVSVAKLGVPAGTPVGREMLRVEVMRVAHRYAATMAEEADRIRDAEGGARLGYFTIGWKLCTRSAALNIAMDAERRGEPARHAGPRLAYATFGGKPLGAEISRRRMRFAR